MMSDKEREALGGGGQGAARGGLHGNVYNHDNVLLMVIMKTRNSTASLILVMVELD